MSKSYRSNLQLCHAYVHQLAEAGRCDNMSFEKGVLYSYATPIAARLGDILVLTTESFSTTTVKHKAVLRSAAIHVREVVSARFIPTDARNQSVISATHRSNVEYFSDQLRTAMGDFLKTTRSRVGKARALIKAFNDIDTYAHVFKLDWANKPLIYQAVEQARLEEQTHNDRDRLENNELVEESFHAWRSGVTNKLPMLKLIKPIALRVTENRIETSRAASMPKSDVEKVWPDLKAMWQSCFGSEDKKLMVANHRLRFGQFRGVQVTKDFIRIGCHDIPWSEVIAIAKQLGLDTTGV